MFLLSLLRTRALKHRSREKACKDTAFFLYDQIFSKENAKNLHFSPKCKVQVTKSSGFFCAGIISSSFSRSSTRVPYFSRDLFAYMPIFCVPLRKISELWKRLTCQCKASRRNLSRKSLKSLPVKPARPPASGAV